MCVCVCSSGSCARSLAELDAPERASARDRDRRFAVGFAVGFAIGFAIGFAVCEGAAQIMPENGRDITL